MCERCRRNARPFPLDPASDVQAALGLMAIEGLNPIVATEDTVAFGRANDTRIYLMPTHSAAQVQ